jgi:two-component system, cell cycle sensor histidine kinase and response regulator CckA
MRFPVRWGDSLTMAAASGLTVLVVDDENVVLSIARLMLSRYGYTVLEAATGAEALRVLELWPEIHIDVALVDVVMPCMTGVELAAKIHRLRPGLPILFTSGYSEKEISRDLISKPNFMKKPFTSKMLVAKICDTLGLPVPSARGDATQA